MIDSVQRQIEKLSIVPNQPMVLVDADEVLVHFAKPFINYLGKRGWSLKLNGYTLQNAIIDTKSKQLANPKESQDLVVGFIKSETHRQTATEGAIEAVHNISKYAQIVIISNVPRYAHNARLKNLKELNLKFPFVSNEGPKGPALKQICKQLVKPAVFIDDNPSQIESAKHFLPKLYRFHFSGCELVRPHIPITNASTHNPNSWKEIENLCYEILA